MKERDLVTRPSVLASLGVAVFAVVMFVLNLSGPLEPRWLLWLAPCGSAVVPFLVACRVARMPRFPAPTRRFWRTLAVCLLLAGAGAVSHANDTVGARPMSVLTVSLYGVTMIVLLWTLIRLPMGVSSRGDMLRITLDAGTVLIAGAAFLWHYEARPAIETTGYGFPTMLVVTVTLLLELVTVFALMKVALAGQAFVARGALRLLAAALLLGAMSSLFQGFVQGRPHLNMVQLTLPLILVCVTAAAERQRTAVPGPARAGRTARRPFSKLPYLAVAAIDGLLLMSTWNGVDAVPTAIAVVALTALVMWRQLTAFRENAELLARLDHSATHDALTRLPNRALFTERLTAAIAGRGAGVALIDLDDFKIVNDTLGHGAGDALLVAVAERLSACVRPGDTAARLGGDEFVVLLDDVTADEAERITLRMIDVLTEPVDADGSQLLVRASIGIAVGEPGTDAGELLRRADIAMYAAKHGGGSRVQRYRTGMTGAVAGSAALGAELQQAVAERQMFLEYEPVVSLDDGRTVGVEALLRWSHPARGAVPPAEFLPVAERTGLIVTLGGWALHEACRQFAAWHAEHGTDAPAGLVVTVSPRQLVDAGFADRVALALTAAGVPAGRLTLAITEGAAPDLDVAAVRVRALRDLGVRIALDDFGSGQSSLALLHELPADQLRPHRSLLARGGAGVATPAALLALAHAAGLEVVAKGVETAEQAAELAGCGYRWAQGAHFAVPAPAGRDGARPWAALSAPASR